MQPARKMSVTNENNKRRCCVLQFIEKPFVGMHDYVCVPSHWVKLHVTKDKVIVAYPENVEYCHKRHHAKKAVAYGDKIKISCKMYTAILKYETDSDKDAERWIAKRKGLVLTDEEDSDMLRDTQPEPVLDKKLRSNTRNIKSNSKTNNPQMTEKLLEDSRKPNFKKSHKRVQSEPKEELKKKRPKLDEAAKSTRTYVDYANQVPGCSKTEESIIFPNFQLIQSDQTKKTAGASRGKKTNAKKITKPQSNNENKSVAKSDSKNTRHSTIFKQASKQGEKQPSPLLQDCKQVPSMQLLNVDEPINGRVINSDKEIQPESITEQIPPFSQIPSHASQLPCQPEYLQEKMTSVELCPDNLIPVPRTQEVSVRQAEETNRHGETTHLHDKTMAERTTAPDTDNQSSQLYQDTDITKNMPSTSNHIPNSVKLSSRLFYNNMTRKPSLKVQKKSFEKKMHLENIISNILMTAGQSNSTDKSSSILTRSVTRHAPLVTQNQSQDGPRVQEMHAKNHTERNGNDQKELNSIDQKTIHQDIANNASAAQSLSNLAHLSDGCVQQSSTRQDLKTQEYYLQENARKQDILRTNNVVQSTVHFQDTINEAFAAQNQSNTGNQPGEFHTPSHENTYLAVDSDLQQKRLSQDLIRTCIENNNTEHRHLSEQNSTNVSNQFHHGFEQEIQLPPNHHYSQRDPRLTSSSYRQKPFVDQPTKTIFTMKRIYDENSIRSSAIASVPKLVNRACQIESLIDKPLSTYQEVVSGYEISVKTPVEIVNDVNCTEEIISPKSDPAVRPTSGNHQVHSRIIAEQQMLNEFATLFNQLGSTLSYTYDTLMNLESTILESAETYKRAVSQFNALENFMISASPSSSVTSEASQATEERRTGEDRENYGNGNENLNNDVNDGGTDNKF